MIVAARIVLTWALIALVAVVLVLVSAPRVFGYQALTVMSGSMEPAVGTGDVVLNRTIPPLQARVGDVVTFTDPHDPSRLITHRVRSIHVAGDRVAVVTKGDANDTTEEWVVPASGTIGAVRYRIPKAGYLLAWLRVPWARVAMLVIPAVVLGAIEIRRIWRPVPKEAADVAGG